MNFYERKAKRTKHYEENVKGWKLRPCSSCNGSGYYDHNDSPDCGACDGSGKERYSPLKEQKEMVEYILRLNKKESWTLRWWANHKDTKLGKQLLETKKGQEIKSIMEAKLI